MANRYWVGGTGTWNTTSTTNWSASSGGASGASVPTAADSVFFDQAGTYTVTMTGALLCLDITVSAGTVTFATGTTPTLAVSGSMTLAAATTWSSTGLTTFNATTTGKTVTTNGVNLTGGVTFNGTGGGWTLGSALTTAGAFTLTAGTVTLSTYILTALTATITGSTARSIAFGTSSIYINGNNATVWGGATLTNFSYTGTPDVQFTYSGATGSRTINHGITAGGTEANAVNFTITGGSDAVGFGVGNICKNLTFNSAYSGSGGFAGASATIYGDVILSANQTVPGNTAAATFSKTGGTQTLTSNGVSIDRPITINSTSTVVLGSALTLIASTSSGTLTLQAGTFDASTYNVTIVTFNGNSTSVRTLSMGSGLWTLTGTGGVWALSTLTNLTFNANTANILLSNTGTTARTFSGGGLTYNKLTIGGATGISTLTISGSNTFSEIASTKTVAHTIKFASSSTQTVSSFTVTGTAGNIVTISSSAAGTAATLSKSSGTVSVDYMSIQDSTATGGATWYAGANSTNVSNNTGWIFTAPPSVNSSSFFLLMGA